MKNATLLITTFMLWLIANACKDKIDKAVIERFSSENTAFVEKVSQLKEIYSKLVNEREWREKEFLKGLSGKGLVAFEKDDALNDQLKVVAIKIAEALDAQKMHLESIEEMVAENMTFIASISASERPEAQIRSDWTRRSFEVDRMLVSVDEAYKEIAELSEEHRALLDRAKDLYYPKKTVSKK